VFEHGAPGVDFSKGVFSKPSFFIGFAFPSCCFLGALFGHPHGFCGGDRFGKLPRGVFFFVLWVFFFLPNKKKTPFFQLGPGHGWWDLKTQPPGGTPKCFSFFPQGPPFPFTFPPGLGGWVGSSHWQSFRDLFFFGFGPGFHLKPF